QKRNHSFRPPQARGNQPLFCRNQSFQAAAGHPPERQREDGPCHCLPKHAFHALRRPHLPVCGEHCGGKFQDDSRKIDEGDRLKGGSLRIHPAIEGRIVAEMHCSVRWWFLSREQSCIRERVTTQTRWRRGKEAAATSKAEAVPGARAFGREA